MNMDDRTYRFVFKDLQPGVAGVSPTVDIEEIENGHRIIINDVTGEKDPVDVLNGVDGTSPTVEVEAETGGHLVTVTDVDGEKSFHVTNGLNPLRVNNALTDCLLGQESDNLMELIDSASSGELPVVCLTGNRVTEFGLSAATGTDEKCFLISKTPKYLPNGAEDLQEEDFIPFNYDHAMNLYCRISGMVQTMGEDGEEYTPKVIICARPSNQPAVLTTVCSLKCGSGGNGIKQFGDSVFPVNDGDLRHENITLNVAVLLVLYPEYQNVDVTAEFYFGQIDFDSEFAQNGNVIGTYNNSMYAENPYRKDDLIIRNDRLYRANWDISQGNRMDAGYDILLTSVSEELKTMRERIAEIAG